MLLVICVSSAVEEIVFPSIVSYDLEKYRIICTSRSSYFRGKTWKVFSVAHTTLVWPTGL